MRVLLAILLLAATPVAARAAAPPAPAEVMIVGVFHMSNPGHDLRNTKVDDMLAPKRQAEIAATAAGLARFKPTKVATEWPADIVADRYPKYLAGTLPPSHNEVVQLGFRLAKTAGSKGVYGIDVDGEFPYDAVKAYAAAHGQAGLLDDLSAATDRSTAADKRLLADKGIAALLRRLNARESVKQGHDFYRAMLRVGSGADQPGAELDAAWYRRNLLICANLVQLAQPGDRIVVFYGSGHGFLLRQCVSETPGLKLIEPGAYLPK